MKHFLRLLTPLRLQCALRRPRIGMRRRKLGRLLLVALAFPLASCRDSQPPKIEICIGDGFGGADCVEADGSKLYRAPSALTSYWMTSEPDEANFASWCYQTTQQEVDPVMNQIRLGVFHR